MEKQELDARMEEMAKMLLSYCRTRTSNCFEAEDLAQDIILEIYKSADNIRNAEAVYGFMWAVAGNVYKQWCRNKEKQRVCEVTDCLPESAGLSDEDDSVLFLLRRELTLLSEKYRKAVILYYMENQSCYEISRRLLISESMVKYLLFKSRRILKEGMNMERNYGQQSYNPKGLSLKFWGSGTNRYFHLCDSMISQNILIACYNDRLTAEQISLEIGVALPYMEDNLAELCEYGLLEKDGNKYYTNIVIFTEDFAREVNGKTAKQKEKIADLLIEKQWEQVMKTYFQGVSAGRNSGIWQMVTLLLYHAVIETLQNTYEITYPTDKFGKPCFIWGAELLKQQSPGSDFEFGISNVANSRGDCIRFMDFPVNGEMVHHYFNHNQNVENVFLDIARGRTESFSENDKALAADMIRRGYVVSENSELKVNVPVFTAEQYEEWKGLFHDAAAEIAEEAEGLMQTVTEVLKNHVPVHLKKSAKDMAYFRLFEDAISAPVAILFDRKELLPYAGEGMLPTTCVILK